VIKTAGAAGIVALAGCTGQDGDGGDGGGDGGDGGDGNGSNGGTTGDGGGDGESYEWTMAAAVGEGHAFDIGAREFKSTIEEMSDGRFTINVQVGGPYGGEVEQMETLAAGGVEMLSQSFGVSHAVYHPEILGNTHVLFIDEPVWERWVELTNAAWEQTDGRQVMADQGLTITSPLAYAGLRHTTATQPIREPADSEGLKIRLPEVAMWPGVFSEFGFEPVALAIDELYSALQQGTVQASEGEIYQVRSQNLQEVQSHYSLTGHFPNAYHFMINTDLYASLPDEDKQLLEEASTQAVESANEQVFNGEEDLIDEISGDDFQIVEDVDRTAFVEQAKGPIEAYYEENDPPLSFEEVQDIIRG
jgi:TRAP-type C4-dicarboxylate transport system substrate-binding protein